MSSELVAQWAKRVSDAEEEVGRMQEDINAVKQQRRALKTDIRKYEDVVAAEKRDLLESLERVEAQAKALGTQCEAALAEKDRVEAAYIAALDEYEKLHFFVRDIQDAEEHLQSREDLEACLQRESLEWAEEEHTLRRSLHQLQQQQSQVRRAQQAELQELEAELASVERRQREERAARCGEVAQAARTVVKGTRQPPLSAEESAFLSANSGGAVPTRAAALRSCMKAAAATTSSTTTGGATGGHSNVNSSAMSAPVSRCASQSLLTESVEKASGSDASSTTAASKPSLQVLQQMRAFSYAGPGKPGSRKREFLGDSTNER
jgi:peptidoglycan hydrolase CwlO-like protein